MWFFHMKRLRNEPDYGLLSYKHPLSTPRRVCDKIFAIQKMFMDGNKNNLLGRQWVTVDDVKSFYVEDTEIHGEQNSN